MSTHKYTHSDAFGPPDMSACSEQVTVDKAYFDALLRRAHFHTRTPGLGHEDPASITISRAEYSGLLRESREYELLKNSLFSGGITPETLALLISGGGDAAPRNSNKINAWVDDFDNDQYGNQHPPDTGMPWKCGNGPRTGNGAYLTGPAHLRVPCNPPPQRNFSYGPTPSSVPDDAAYGEVDSVDGSHMYAANNGSNTQRTLYFAGFTAGTTLHDLLSVIKGGKIISVSFRSEKSATVTFFDAAADFLAWTKRYDIYLHSKRIEVHWADRQFRLNQHISNKVSNGATRNLCIRGAASHGLTAERIQEDMEHIHNLVIVYITYRNKSGDAYISTNSVHNALFARTCMMSRSTYKGCKIEFYPDDCDVPIPPPAPRSIVNKQQELDRKGFETMNRFGLLELDDGGSSDTENRGPCTARTHDEEEEEEEGEEEGLEDEALDWSHQGVSLG